MSVCVHVRVGGACFLMSCNNISAMIFSILLYMSTSQHMIVLMWHEVGNWLASLKLRQSLYKMMSEVIFQTGLHE